ncbi:hypothetical protein QG516_00075 [Pedobacter gandavensis]|uniref:hypothetical protein n=1 Tax=Pedobacter gandavensis TaxID=2679963 RepID=UPI002479B596|nr:hypothetical protein [Pedobacter gandavensis]WGQ10051.1 hypothetical protein QG516_00075 [Pedobacter gandavensis]
MKKHLIILLLCTTSCLWVRAAAIEPDSLLISRVLKELGIPLAKTKEEFIRTKAMPNDPGKTIFSIPVLVSEEGGSSYTMDAYVLVVESATGKILQKYDEEGYWESDAVRIEDIGIDTAPYRLNPQTRAFGITTQFVGSSSPNPFSQTTISLFVPQGNTLIKVVDKLVLEQYNGEWDMHCAGVFENKMTNIEVSSSKTNGYADLLINSKITNTESFKMGEECEAKVVKNKLNKSVLKFSRGSYHISPPRNKPVRNK